MIGLRWPPSFFFFFPKESFKRIGERIVVTTTTMTTGPNKRGDIRPTAAPLLATIRATSPRDTIPQPICRDSLLLNPESLAPIPQPTILVIIATPSSTSANTTIIMLISVSTTDRPTLAKKMGESSV